MGIPTLVDHVCVMMLNANKGLSSGLAIYSQIPRSFASTSPSAGVTLQNIFSGLKMTDTSVLSLGFFL